MITHIEPYRTNNYNAEECRWGSIRQPYIFRFFRRDGEYTTFTSVSGNMQLSSTTLYGYTPVIGEILTVIDNVSKRKLVGKVTNFAAGVITTDIPVPPTGTFAPGYILWQKREAYKIRLKISAFIPTLSLDATDFIELGDAIGTPDSIGVTKIDVRQLLTYGCEKINKYNFTDSSAIEYSGWIKFVVSFSDKFIYEGAEQTTVRDAVIDKTFYGIDAVKQLLNVYGQNFCDYQPTEFYPAKFLSGFRRPTYFVGYPFSLSVIMPEEFEGEKPNLCIIYYDNSGGTFLTPDFINTAEASVTSFKMLDLPPGISHIEAWLQPEANTIPTMIPPPGNYFVDDPDNAYRGTIPEYAITEMKHIEINNNCREYPVYLMWKNQLGGWDFWLFSKVNETNITAAQGERYDLYVEDLEFANANNRIIQASAVKTVTVGDVVDIDMAEGIAGIERSPAVFVLHDSTKLATAPELAWMRVQIAPKGVKYRSNAGKVTVEIAVVFPEYYTIPN